MAFSSSFYSDGYRDGYNGVKPSPPSVPVLAAEYFDGYEAGVEAEKEDYYETHGGVAWN